METRISGIHIENNWGEGVVMDQTQDEYLGALRQGWGQVQLTKYTKYSKGIPSTSTGQVLIFFKKYLSKSSTFISSTSTSTSTHIKICSKVMMDKHVQSRVNFGWTKQKSFPQIMSLLNSQDVHIFYAE